ncbi:ATP-binding cassette subfamily B protein [Paenibacillus cellulosilyticus]|uniref:ATP-binding cassette subfamily B protein n=2 Tax=Paenibacillus cellulosilyticus TaxID=375489 RepID=A0A2V2YNJ2_9BACL|nr:ATP-binding cassette subfamily B protein [Paenibacillus cellulosilyticus]
MHEDILSTGKRISYYHRLLRLMFRLHPVISVIWCLMILIPSIFPLLQVWLNKTAIDRISELTGNSLILNQVLFIVAALYLCNVAVVVVGSITNYFYTILKEDVGYQLKVEIARKALSIPFSGFEDSKLYDRMQLAQSAVAKNILDAIKSVMQAVSLTITLLGMIGILFVAHWSLPIVLLGSALPGILLLLIVKKRRVQLAVTTTPQGREMEYTYKLMLARETAKEIRLYHLGETLLSRWEQIFNQVRKLFLKQTVRESLSETIGVMMLSLASGGVAIVLVYQIAGGHLTIGDYVALSTSIITLQAALGNFGQHISDIFVIGLHVTHYYDFIDENHNQSHAEENLLVDIKECDQIFVKNLNYYYNGNDMAVLENISFNVRNGEKIAIVGENGAGKSTLVNCLLGLYPVPEKTIYYGNTDLQRIDKMELWSQVSAVFQDFVKYQYSLRDNVGFGWINRLDDDELIMKALKSSGMGLLNERLVNGLESTLGRLFQDGQELSGGQWQRIAIARAFMRPASLLLFDEPTAALDPNAEMDIFRRFLELSKDKTAIMVSHRLGPARLADRILVLKSGRIVEQGTHQELMELSGEYASMFNSQAAWYQDNVDYSVIREVG